MDGFVWLVSFDKTITLMMDISDDLQLAFSVICKTIVYHNKYCVMVIIGVVSLINKRMKLYYHDHLHLREVYSLA